MCHSDDSRPPAPPTIGAVRSHGPLTLTAVDGNTFDAYAAHPLAPSGTGIVILPDVRGLHEYYKELAVRFAEAGFHAVAIDYYARTAGRTDRTGDFDWQTHKAALTDELVTRDAVAGVGYLRARGLRNVFTVGFCFGGSSSWRQAAAIPGLAGAIGFYGQPAPLVAAVDDVRAPLLLLLAGADASINAADFDAPLATLHARGVAADRHVYAGAPHSFFDRSFAQHQAACADAWQRVLTFIDSVSA